MLPLRLLLILLSLASVVCPRPFLEITPVQSSSTIKEETGNPDIPVPHGSPPPVIPLDETKYRANLMLRKMDQVISEPTKPEHQEIMAASFGTLRAGQIDEIRDTIRKINNTNVRVRLHTMSPGEKRNKRAILATTRFIRPAPGAGARRLKGKTIYVADSVKFSNEFSDSAVNEKAGILIRQTAEYAARASTDALMNRSRSLGDEDAGTIHSPARTYNPDKHMHLKHFIIHENQIARTPAGVNRDRAWANLKSFVSNMHQSSEAYRVMAHLCDAAIPDKPVKLTHVVPVVGDW